MAFDIDIRRRIGGRIIGLSCRTDNPILAIVGRSGVGKTTILNMIAGISQPDHGFIQIGDHVLFDSALGVDVPPRARGAGYVFQDRRLFPHMRVRGNLLYGHKGDGPFHLADVVDRLGIAHLMERWPRNLSGGEAQRVSLGRVLLRSPAYLLLDEPMSMLDIGRKTIIFDTLRYIRNTLSLPIVLVTHSLEEARTLSAHIVSLDKE